MLLLMVSTLTTVTSGLKMYKVYATPKALLARWKDLEKAKQYAHLYADKYKVDVYITGLDKFKREVEIYRVEKQKEIG